MLSVSSGNGAGLVRADSSVLSVEGRLYGTDHDPYIWVSITGAVGPLSLAKVCGFQSLLLNKVINESPLSYTILPSAPERLEQY